MNLVNRIRKIKKALPSKRKWDRLNSGERDLEIINLFAQDEKNRTDTRAFIFFTKAYKDITDDNLYQFNFQYDKLIQIIELAEKYAKNIAFI